MFDFKRDAEGIYEAVINGYGVRFDPSLSNITYSIGGRVFKKLHVIYRFSTKSDPTILITDNKQLTIEFLQTMDEEQDQKRIMFEAGTYAEEM